MIEPSNSFEPRTGIYNPNQSNGNRSMAESLGKAVQLLKPYPCSFTLGEADLGVKDEANNLPGLTLPYVHNSKWLELSEKLVGDEDDDFEQPVGWKENLLTRAHAELGNLKKAREINKAVLDQHEDDIVALGNSAFLCFKCKDVPKAFEVLQRLEELSTKENFWEQKVRAIGEQGYEYRKFGGAGHLLNSIRLLSLALKYRPDDEHMQYNLALVYRRCTHIQMYAECPDEINLHDFALEGATRMWKLSHSARNQTTQAAALAQLAYLRYNDESHTKTSMSKCTQMLTPREWKNIVGGNGWRSLVDMALKTLGDAPSTQVLNIVGQLLKYSKIPADNVKAMNILERSIKIKPTTRAHHHLGLLYRRKCINFETNNKPNTAMKYKTLDPRRTGSMHGTVEEPAFSNLLVLRRLIKSVHDKVKPFQGDNPFIKMALEHYERAVRISHWENRSAAYDLAMMYIQTGKYRDSKQCCQNIISGSGCALMNEYPLHLVNAYNLYGQCCVLEAETQTKEQLKEFLWDEGEEKLMRALEVAAKLAGKVPELATCITQLWGAFDKLEKRFKFTGSKASEEKLFKICELVADYRPYLQALDEEVWQAVGQSVEQEVLERKVKCFLHDKELDKARACLCLGELKSRDTGSLSWQNSQCVRQVMLLSARQALRNQFQGQVIEQDLSGTGDPQIWRQIFHEAIEEDPALGTTASAAIKSDKTYKHDVVILDESYDDNGDPNPRSTSFNVANILKKIISEVFGLRVIMAHEEVDPGMSVWITLQDTISQSTVVIFILAGTGRKSPIAETKKVSSMGSSGGKTEQSVIVNQVADAKSISLEKCSVEIPGLSREMDHSDDEPSQMFKLLFHTSVENSANVFGPRYILSIASDRQALFRYPGVEHLYLSHKDISELSKFTDANIVEPIMKLFKALVKQSDLNLEEVCVTT